MLHDLRVLGIKLGTGAFNDLLANSLLGNGLPVASFGSHGIICIGNGNDTRDFGNVLAFKLVGIPLAVVPFMMVMSSDGQIGILADSGQDLVAYLGMLLHDLVFFPGELAFLVDDMLGNTDLTHVMEKRNIIDVLAILVTHSRKLRDLLGILRNS